MLPVMGQLRNELGLVLQSVFVFLRPAFVSWVCAGATRVCETCCVAEMEAALCLLGSLLATLCILSIIPPITFLENRYQVAKPLASHASLGPWAQHFKRILCAPIIWPCDGATLPTTRRPKTTAPGPCKEFPLLQASQERGLVTYCFNRDARPM